MTCHGPLQPDVNSGMANAKMSTNYRVFHEVPTWSAYLQYFLVFFASAYTSFHNVQLYTRYTTLFSYIYIYIYSNSPDNPKITIVLELARSFLKAWLVWVALGWYPTLIYFRWRLSLEVFRLSQWSFWILRSSGICSRHFVTAWWHHLQAFYV